MGSRDGTKIVGVTLVVLAWVTLAFWASMAVFPQVIPPLSPWPDWTGFFQQLDIAPWIRQQAGLNRPETEIISALNRDLLFSFAFQWLAILAGASSGVLLIVRRKAGWWLATVLCALFLGRFIAGELHVFLKTGTRYPEIWITMAKTAPRIAIRGAINVVFYTLALVLLMRGRPRRGSLVPTHVGEDSSLASAQPRQEH